MPRLSVLQAAAHVGHAAHAALLDEHQPRGAEAGRHADLEASVAAKQAGILTVECHRLADGTGTRPTGNAFPSV